MTVWLWMVRMEFVGTLTQFSVPMSVLCHVSKIGRRYIPRSKVRGSLATRTMSAPLSRLSI